MDQVSATSKLLPDLLWSDGEPLTVYDSVYRFNLQADPDFPWLPLVITSTVVGIWYWCTDQYIVQRVLTAKNTKVGRRGAIWGGFLKLMPVFLFLIPGVIALALKQKGELDWDTPDQAFPVLMTSLLPAGLRGLVAAGLLAALMSSLASVFNSCSTLFTVDIYKKLRPHTSEKRLLTVGRIATAIVVILGVAWIPIMANISGVLYEYLQSVQAYIAPPITAVFLLGIFWKRINAQGALWTLVSGLAIAVFRIILEISRGSLNPDGLLYKIGDINFLKFASVFFLVSVATTIVVSLLTEAPSVEKIRGLAFGTLTAEQKQENKESYNTMDIILSLIVVAIVVFVMISFS